MADDSPMITLTKINPALAVAWTIIQAGSAVALLAIVIGGLPLAVIIIRRALSNCRQGLGLLLVPAASFLALVAYVLFLLAVGAGRIQRAGVMRVVQPGVFPPGNRLLMEGLMLTFILGTIASTLGIWKLISCTDVEQDTFQALFVRQLTFPSFFAILWADLSDNQTACLCPLF
jgi:hypothetical protein